MATKFANSWSYCLFPLLSSNSGLLRLFKLSPAWVLLLLFISLTERSPSRHFCGLLSHLILVFAQKSPAQRQPSWQLRLKQLHFSTLFPCLVTLYPFSLLYFFHCCFHYMNFLCMFIGLLLFLSHMGEGGYLFCLVYWERGSPST